MDWHWHWISASHWVMLGLLVVFACVHSGLAALRPRAEAIVGARLYRVFFALMSLPLAVVLVAYFLHHRYDGLQLWQLQGVPGMRSLVWGLSALSFGFLFPATFNLLEVAAFQKPQVHLYETGIIRVTRHPQMVGQVIWCIAHALWLGTSFTLVTCLGLILHHLFGVWHGDRRWQSRLGDAYIEVKQRTSVIPFVAIAQGRQSFVWREFIKPAYVGVALFVGGFWLAHPWLKAVSGQIPW
ncbi:MAG: NnrU family protein [Cyanobacteria bacterium J06642_2]